MIGEFVPARHPELGEVLLISLFPLVVGTTPISTAVVADRQGGLHYVVGAEILSIDWHYDEADGKWKADFE